ncbi:MAG TPA: mechanosensitive ion channel family protein [Tepidisphaeraceae bacterium]|jgi:small-conductance mechanosensitive channel|nr:mechanosensitive ion channel family protein [Tepidisphaeraceae bacterium]
MPELSSLFFRRGRSIRLAVVAALFVLIARPLRAADPASQDENIMAYIDHTINWHSRATGIDQATADPQEVTFRNAVRQNSARILHLSFVFGKSQAALLATEKKPSAAPATSQAGKLAQAVIDANERVARIQAQLELTTQQIAKSQPQPPDELTARREKLLAELNLATTRREVVQNFAGFNGAAAGGLAQKIDDLEKSTPDAEGEPKAVPNAKAEAVVPAQIERPESMGILGLITEMFTLTSRMSDVTELEKFTEKLKASNEALRAPIRAELKDAVGQGDVLSKTKDDADVKTLNDDRQKIEALVARYKLISSAVVPLSEQGILLDAARGDLGEWHTLLKRNYTRTIRALVIRLGAIATAILILLTVSSLWRRATFKYVTDIRRRRQFLLVRRLVVGTIVLLIVVGGMVTEFSSLATFAGLITAGVAVALQTVILSGVAHFFFMGRYGVRVGDRVTISGITGDVIDMGVFRLYLMELGGSGRDLQPTGRIVVFSNSVLFQSSAFFKQIPGADYTWHEMDLTLGPDTDHTVAEKRLLETVNGVVDGYRDVIAAQYKNLKATVHFPLPPPEPQGRLRFVNKEVEFVVRYPVEISRAAEIDDLMTRRLIDTIAADPKLHSVAVKSPSA